MVDHFARVIHCKAALKLLCSTLCISFLHEPCGCADGPACWLVALADASLALLLPPLGCCACCGGRQWH